MPGQALSAQTAVAIGTMVTEELSESQGSFAQLRRRQYPCRCPESLLQPPSPLRSEGANPQRLLRESIRMSPEKAALRFAQFSWETYLNKCEGKDSQIMREILLAQMVGVKRYR
jgi:hypothetical protein